MWRICCIWRWCTTTRRPAVWRPGGAERRTHSGPPRRPRSPQGPGQGLSVHGAGSAEAAASASDNSEGFVRGSGRRGGQQHPRFKHSGQQSIFSLSIYRNDLITLFTCERYGGSDLGNIASSSALMSVKKSQKNLNFESVDLEM